MADQLLVWFTVVAKLLQNVIFKDITFTNYELVECLSYGMGCTVKTTDSSLRQLIGMKPEFLVY